MQDKEIDQLFRSEFEDFEVAPSAKVWGDINHNLDSGKSKKALLTYLSIAASLLLIAGLGWYFIPQEVPESVTPEQIAITTAVKPGKANTSVVTVDVLPSNTVAHNAVIQTATSHKTNKVVKPVIEENAPAPIIHEPAPAEQLAQNTARNPEIGNAVVPGVETALIARTEVDDEPAFTTRQPVATTQVLKTEKVLAAAPVKKHRISTFGDLINVVVSKVDKRKDKIIEFSSSDEDESTISAVNLGFVKIKKQD